MKADAIRAKLLAMTSELEGGKTICPSDVARAISGSDEKEWRTLMSPIRVEAVRLADEGLVTIKRKGRAVDPHDFKGVYRLAAGGLPD